ncbi:MAG: hypothetical protein ACHQ4F_14160 [Candidatus Dormibacteria bacterium]
MDEVAHIRQPAVVVSVGGYRTGARDRRAGEHPASSTRSHHSSDWLIVRSPNADTITAKLEVVADRADTLEETRTIKVVN